MTEKQEIFEYLDDLRESGITSIFGAGPYIAAEFAMSDEKSMSLLREWMETFAERHGATDED